MTHGLGHDLEQSLGAEPPAPDAIRTAVRRIELALSVGLSFDLGADGELAYRRGHARNVALVLRRSIDEALGADPARRADLLAQAARFAGELGETVSWIGQHAMGPVACAPREPWAGSWAGRLLGLTARLLPPELRREFVEDQCGNLAAVESRREWFAYLLSLLTHMPRIAAASAQGRSRW